MQRLIDWIDWLTQVWVDSCAVVFCNIVRQSKVQLLWHTVGQGWRWWILQRVLHCGVLAAANVILHAHRLLHPEEERKVREDGNTWSRVSSSYQSWSFLKDGRLLRHVKTGRMGKLVAAAKFWNARIFFGYFCVQWTNLRCWLQPWPWAPPWVWTSVILFVRGLWTT